MLKGCLESTVRYDSVWKFNNSDKILYTLAGGPLNVEALGFSLSIL
jgi:hypothetical protein